MKYLKMRVFLKRSMVVVFHLREIHATSDYCYNSPYVLAYHIKDFLVSYYLLKDRTKNYVL